MGQTFDLGFQIDTTGLQKAGTEAHKAAEQVAHLGDAERKLATEATKTGAALKNEGDAAKEAAAKKAALGEATSTLTGKLRLQQQDVTNLASAMRGQQGLVGGLDAAAQSGMRLFGGLSPLTLGLGLAAVAAGFLGKELYDTAMALGTAQDKMAGLEARLKSALGSTTAAKSAMAELYEQTQKTGLGFNSAADAFARVARNNASIGLTQREMLQMSETVQKLGAASGASQGEMTGAMVQFGQALASGRLQGDELRSIMENLPPLAKAIADNFEKADGTIGITIGTLRKMGSEGELTSGKIAEAVLRATDKARAEFDKLPTTMAQSAQRMGDAWEMMLAKMGEKLQASGLIQMLGNATTDFVNGITKALEGPTLDERIATLQKAVREAKPTQEYSSSGNMAKQDGVYGQTSAQRDTLLQADKDALARALAARGKLWQEQAAQAFQEQQGKLIAPSSAVEAQTAEFAPLSEKVRAAGNTVSSLNEAISNLNQAIERGGSKDYDVETLTANRDRLVGRLQAANAAVASIMTEAGKFAQQIGDAKTADQLGGQGGGISIVQAAITRQRADQKTSSAGGLQSYIDAGISNALISANQELDTFGQKVTDAQSQLSLVGKGVGESMAVQVEQEAKMARLQRFGDLQSPKITAWAASYKAGLMDVKQATQDAAEAQQAFAAEQDGMIARAKLGAGLDARSQQDAEQSAQFEKMKSQFTGGANDPDYIRTVEAMRKKTADERLLAERQTSKSLEDQLQNMADMRGLQMLSSTEYRVQAALIAKKLELEKEGVKVGTADYNNRLRLTELIERQKVADEKGTPQSRTMKSFNDGADKIEGIFKNMWRDVFTNGVESGAQIFGKGMSDIILDISAQMMNELVYKPFEEMIRVAIQTMANWAIQQLFGGGMQTGAGAISQVSNGSSGPITLPGVQKPFGSADGNAFFGPLSSFANGSSFSNKVHDTRTLFSFARGTKLGEMAEAGPEAVMPLDRGADGRLGVRASGVGGGGSEVNIYDQRGGQDSSPVEVKERKGPDGRRIIDIMIRDAQKKNIRSGAVDRDMTNVYGAQRQLPKR